MDLLQFSFNYFMEDYLLVGFEFRDISSMCPNHNFYHSKCYKCIRKCSKTDIKLSRFAHSLCS